MEARWQVSWVPPSTGTKKLRSLLGRLPKPSRGKVGRQGPHRILPIHPSRVAHTHLILKATLSQRTDDLFYQRIVWTNHASANSPSPVTVGYEVGCIRGGVREKPKCAQTVCWFRPIHHQLRENEREPRVGDCVLVCDGIAFEAAAWRDGGWEGKGCCAGWSVLPRVTLTIRDTLPEVAPLS